MKMPKPTVDDIFALFTTPWPEGLSKTGAKLHPLQSAGEYTLVTLAELYDEKKYYRWQRDENGNPAAEPAIYQY